MNGEMFVFKKNGNMITVQQFKEECSSDYETVIYKQGKLIGRPRSNKLLTREEAGKVADSFA